MINDEILELEVPAKLVNGRTLVPLRFVSEALGCDVHWDASVSLVRITYNSKVLDLPPLPPNEQIPVVLDLTKIPKGQGEITITHGQYLFP
ncbi:hypothetical protein J2Z37_004858 [Ammoniphilus resinae]|uniref:Copper amine oxidase-like N-terminal domain-containing protein n=2 Tax=Ammoniphilus resinae TaxID=861532 RepID=A0ABS4GX27_9BACL|nr:hypothetical protein [Ammoniphilus resinae]